MKRVFSLLLALCLMFCILPLKPDGTYRAFLEQLWPYQLTPQPAPLTDKLANKLYDWSGGIPAYIIKIFQESQALLQGQSSLNEKTMQRAIDILAIKVPKTYSGGTFISDFELEGVPPSDFQCSEEVPRLYAIKRGRKVTQWDEGDLLAAYKAGCDMLHCLKCELIIAGRAQLRSYIRHSMP